MFGINGKEAQHFYDNKPHTFKAMQHFVMAMDDYVKGYGKKTWLGRDKSADVTTMLAVNVGRTVSAMRADGIIATDTAPTDIHHALQEEVNIFFEAFPAWTTAFAFSIAYFSDEMSKNTIAIYVRHW